MPKGVYKRPLTYKQKRALYFTMPGPLGLGMTHAQAAQALGIKRQSVTDYIARIKKHYPEAYENYKTCHNVMRRQGRNLTSGLNHYSRISSDKWIYKIVETF